jgi:polyferredoxin
MLLVLTTILLFQDALTRRVALYRATRLTFLAMTFAFLGLYAGAQLSIVNVVTFSQALLHGFKWENFLLDPLIFLLWSFTAAALLFWGRGVFCGWLCPFGALQELLNEGAKRLGVKQVQVPWPLHERLWLIKYVAFLLILAFSLNSAADAFRVAEIEPFKTAIALKFQREFVFVAYALALLFAGLFIERFFCRYLCPLGAGLAIPAKLKLFDWLKRRPQCGTECHICELRCTVQAIDPIGRINPNECIYCQNCQANYYDSNTCMVLIRRAARRQGGLTPGADRFRGRSP